MVPGWQASADHKRINREFVCKDFVSAVAFINALAQLAEAEGHHPDLTLYSWNHLRVTLWTHPIAGPSENDFILAAKVNALAAKRSKLFKAA